LILDSKQIKSINYQLSNVRFIQVGWTVRPDMSTFDDFDYVSDDDEEEDEDVIVPARLTNEAIKVLTIRLF
jgi:hypothetical protein